MKLKWIIPEKAKPFRKYVVFGGKSYHKDEGIFDVSWIIGKNDTGLKGVKYAYCYQWEYGCVPQRIALLPLRFNKKDSDFIKYDPKNPPKEGIYLTWQSIYGFSRQAFGTDCFGVSKISTPHWNSLPDDVAYCIEQGFFDLYYMPFPDSKHFGPLKGQIDIGGAYIYYEKKKGENNETSKN